MGERVNDTQVMASSVNAGKVTILVVEDEVLVRAFVSDVLREQGYTVIEAVTRMRRSLSFAALLSWILCSPTCGCLDRSMAPDSCDCSAPSCRLSKW